ncbi:hypothetical protein CICLE_v10013370mg [Citrus x clementina]|uniref:AAA+ ATPase domain-containing protein n=2 Tax=Citrus clementina TaxID=85681 RepID=V4SU77_CITCL|nr:hypothetical protein CICLE_v10013370mg [Citrus x clementina]
MGETWGSLGSTLATLMFVFAMFKQHIPRQAWYFLEKHCHKLVSLFNPYLEITFYEFSINNFLRNKAYSEIQSYLSGREETSLHASRFKADVIKDSRRIALSMEDYEEVSDEYKGVRVWWVLGKKVPRTPVVSFYPGSYDERDYTLTFHKRYRELITGDYVNQVLEEGKAIAVTNRQRKLYKNVPSRAWYENTWSHVYFEHPATFDTLAMASKKKEAIKKDLIKFTEGKEYYAKIGKAWNRGYLLFGPPGTGKSTMIAAMANCLNYDVYDLELTSVENNNELRSLLVDISSKSIIVIEDIYCSLDLSGKRKENEEEEEVKEEKNSVKNVGQRRKKKSNVTLSGLLNCIDGLWSTCGGERIIVFTTNHVDKLDPALIRRGRMDKHIEMPYCCFEAFKVLAKNYLEIESHELFHEIGSLLGETYITPADVAENLMPKSDEDDAGTCLKNLIEALKAAKEKAKKNAGEEAELKAEEANGSIAKGNASN